MTNSRRTSRGPVWLMPDRDAARRLRNTGLLDQSAGTWASSLGKPKGACSWPLTGTEAAIPIPAMRLHGIVLDSEGGHLYLYLLQISVTVTFNAHVRTDASASRSADCVKGGGAVDSWTASMLEKTQLWPNRSRSVVDPRPQLEVKGWGEGEKSVNDAFFDATFYPRLLRLSYTTPDSNNEHSVVRVRVNRRPWSLKFLSHCVLGDPPGLSNHLTL